MNQYDPEFEELQESLNPIHSAVLCRLFAQLPFESHAQIVLPTCKEWESAFLSVHPPNGYLALGEKCTGPVNDTYVMRLLFDGRMAEVLHALSGEKKYIRANTITTDGLGTYLGESVMPQYVVKTGKSGLRPFRIQKELGVVSGIYLPWKSAIVLESSVRVFQSVKSSENWIKSLNSLKPGDKIVFPNSLGSVVEYTIYDENHARCLPEWYLTKIQKEQLFTVKTKYHDVPLDSITYITPIGSIPGYSFLRGEVLLPSDYIVLYVSGFPLCRVLELYDQHFSVKPLANPAAVWYLKYDFPMIKKLESLQEAEKWRVKRMHNLDIFRDQIQPGDFVIKTHTGQEPASLKNIQKYLLVRKIVREKDLSESRTSSLYDDSFMDEAFSSYGQGLREDENPFEIDITQDKLSEKERGHVEREEMMNKIIRDKHRLDNSKKDRYRLYITEKIFIYRDEVQDVIKVPSIESQVLRMNFETVEVRVGDQINGKSGGKYTGKMYIDKIVKGGIVLNGVFYPIEKINVTGHTPSSMLGAAEKLEDMMERRGKTGKILDSDDEILEDIENIDLTEDWSFIDPIQTTHTSTKNKNLPRSDGPLSKKHKNDPISVSKKKNPSPKNSNSNSKVKDPNKNKISDGKTIKVAKKHSGMLGVQTTAGFDSMKKTIPKKKTNISKY